MSSHHIGGFVAVAPSSSQLSGTAARMASEQGASVAAPWPVHRRHERHRQKGNSTWSAHPLEGAPLAPRHDTDPVVVEEEEQRRDR